ncbi:MAG: phosphopantetheine-binding protein [Pseudolabrys sp.]|jgi:acyl carrier protein
MREKIIAEIEKIAAEQEKPLKPITDDLEILDSGLDSLCFAILVARLEDMVGFDPFNTDDEIAFPTTFSEFFALYEKVPA